MANSAGLVFWETDAWENGEGRPLKLFARSFWFGLFYIILVYSCYLGRNEMEVVEY